MTVQLFFFFAGDFFCHLLITLQTVGYIVIVMLLFSKHDYLTLSLLVKGFYCLLITFANRSGSKLDDALVVFLKEFIEHFNFEKNQQMTKRACKISQHAKS